MEDTRVDRFFFYLRHGEVVEDMRKWSRIPSAAIGRGVVPVTRVGEPDWVARMADESAYEMAIFVPCRNEISTAKKV